MTPSYPPGTPPRQLAIEHPTTDDSTKKRQWYKLLEPRKWKVALYDVSLVLLPTLLAIYAKLKIQNSEACAHISGCINKECGESDLFRALLFAFLIYAILALIIAFFQAGSYKEVKNKDMPACLAIKKGLMFFPIVVLFFVPELPKLGHTLELLISLGVALFSSVIFNCAFSLPEEYRQASERLDRTAKIQGIIYLTTFFLTLVWFVWVYLAWPVCPEDISPCARS